MNIGGGLFHCISRTVGGEALLGDAEKGVFCRMLERVAEFSGVEVLTYCVMSNHFHLLVRVREAGSVEDAELVRRYAVLYPEESLKYAPAPGETRQLRGSGGGGVCRRGLWPRFWPGTMPRRRGGGSACSPECTMSRRC